MKAVGLWKLGKYPTHAVTYHHRVTWKERSWYVHQGHPDSDVPGTNRRFFLHNDFRGILIRCGGGTVVISPSPRAKNLYFQPPAPLGRHLVRQVIRSSEPLNPTLRTTFYCEVKKTVQGIFCIGFKR